MDIKDIQELLKFINRSTLTDVEIEQKDFRLRIQRKQEMVYAQAPMMQQMMPQYQQVHHHDAPPAVSHAPAAPEAEAKPVDAGKNLFEFRAPLIGTFYRASSPDKPALVNVGDTIVKGQALGIIEAMKLFNEIESDVAGKIVKILVDNAKPVEYDQPLFLIELT
jgi:acetyl-CoA carboxylase biotin carboxyl carrier protein